MAPGPEAGRAGKLLSGLAGNDEAVFILRGAEGDDSFI